MINGRKNSLKHRTALILPVWLFILLTFNSYGNYNKSPYFDNLLTAYQQDTTPRGILINDTIPQKDSLLLNDSTLLKDSTIKITDTFGVKISKDSLQGPVTYSASDSMVLDIPNNKIIFYSKANIKYTDVDLKADSIEFDQQTKIVTATSRRDSTGNMIGRPSMVQGESNMEADLIRFNFESQKGITENTLTQQGEAIVHGEKVKRVNENVYYAFRGIITTCNLDTPHFAFRTKKLKLINQKLAVTGPVHPEFEGVPVPIYLPFGFFPLSQGRHSGLLAPSFSTNEQFGLGLEGLGYYKVLNDYFDVTVRTNLYSYGGWSLFVNPTYRKRYRYNGAFNFSFQKTRILSSDPKQEFINSQTFNIAWNHSVDSRARPGTSFSASVNAGSTKFNQFVSNNPTVNFTNQLSSSITYSKSIGDKYNLTVTANHNQNNRTRLINMSLPNISFTANTIYPLQPKEFVGQSKWYHKLGIGLNTNIANQVSFLEEEFSFRKILDTMQWGAQHSIPIQLSLPAMGPLQIAPGISYQEKWHSRKQELIWNPSAKKLDTVVTKGFFTTRDVSFSLGLSTAIFGLFDKFGKNSPLTAIRHVIRPTMSVSYKPNLAKNDYYNVQVDTMGRVLRLPYYTGSIFGPFGEGTFGGISFGVDNNLEAKIRSKKDTTDGGIKKVRLIDGFGFNSSYNFMADSFKLSTFSLYVRSTLFEKINITAGATLDPYQVDAGGYRINKYAWSGDKFSPGRITNGNIAVSTSFQSKPKDEDKAKKQEEELDNANLPPLTPEEELAQLNYIQQNAAEFADFNIPWSLSLSFSMNFSRQFKPDFSGFETNTTANLNWNGDFNLTPKWKVGLNGYYDISNKNLQTLSMYISREMHCWQLSINVTPVSYYRFFNITISPKSGILRDLRINRTRSFSGL